MPFPIARQCTALLHGRFQGALRRAFKRHWVSADSKCMEPMANRHGDATENRELFRVEEVRAFLSALWASPAQAWQPDAALRSSIAAALRGAPAQRAVNTSVERLVAWLNATEAPLAQRLPEEVLGALRTLAARPLSLDPRLARAIVDQPLLRARIRAMLLEEILAFGRRASAPVSGVAKGIGSIAKFAGGRMLSATRLGSVVDAVGGEVERHLEARAEAFADAAVGRVVAHIVAFLSDPSSAAEAGRMKRAMIDGFLEMKGPQLAREVMNADFHGGAEALRSALAHWMERRDDAAPEHGDSIDDPRLPALSLAQLLQEIGVNAQVLRWIDKSFESAMASPRSAPEVRPPT